MVSKVKNNISQTFLYKIDREKRDWFKLLLQLKGSVVPAITIRVILCALFALIISVLNALGIDVSIDSLSSLVPSIVLGLLLVFRTNTAYDRFWEGRKLWGKIIITARNFARNIWVTVEEKNQQDRDGKIATIRLLVSFAITTKLNLRSEVINEELKPYISEARYEKLKQVNHPPLEIAVYIGDYLQQQYAKKHINAYQLTAMLKYVDDLVEAWTGCQRVLNTPIPLAYSIHLKQLLLIYCFALPFQVVHELQWWTAPIVAMISFAVFGIEEIGIEIENPFGYDANDLPLDKICEVMQENMEDLMSCEPSVGNWQYPDLGEEL